MTWILEEKYKLPIQLPDEDKMTKAEFVEFCIANSDLRIERDEHKEIFIMPPVFGETGRKHVQISFEIELWNRRTKLGQTFDSSTGFDLPDGSMRSPDASWIKKEDWDKLSDQQKNSFLPLAPTFVAELLSSSDRQVEAETKMRKWIKNGTQLGWLIIPKIQKVFFYRADGSSDVVSGFDKKISGENVLPGFEFDLSSLL